MMKTFHRTLFSAQLETVTLLKRGDDQQQGTVTSYTVFRCRRSLIVKSGEPLAGDMTSNHRAIFHIPRLEMDRIGIVYLNADDVIVDKQGRRWQPEGEGSGTEISDKLMEVEYDVQCVRIK